MNGIDIRHTKHLALYNCHIISGDGKGQRRGIVTHNEYWPNHKVFSRDDTVKVD